jgi:hypothetical protein
MCLLVASVVLRQRMGVGHITLPYKYKYEGLQVRGSSGSEVEAYSSSTDNRPPY